MIVRKMCIPDGSTVLTAEAKAIDLALDFVNNCTYTDKFVIFSNPLSVLQALNHASSKNSQIQHLLLKHHDISSSKTVIYCWILSHIGIYGNEKVDKNAIKSLNLEMTAFYIPFYNFKSYINKYVFNSFHDPIIRVYSAVAKHLQDFLQLEQQRHKLQQQLEQFISHDCLFSSAFSSSVLIPGMRSSFNTKSLKHFGDLHIVANDGSTFLGSSDLGMI